MLILLLGAHCKNRCSAGLQACQTRRTLRSALHVAMRSSASCVAPYLTSTHVARNIGRHTMRFRVAFALGVGLWFVAARGPAPATARLSAQGGGGMFLGST